MARVMGTGKEPISAGVIWDIADDSDELEDALESGVARLLSPEEDPSLAPVHIASAMVRGDYDAVNQPATDPVELALAESMGLDGAREIVDNPEGHGVLAAVAPETLSTVNADPNPAPPEPLASAEAPAESAPKKAPRKKAE